MATKHKECKSFSTTVEEYEEKKPQPLCSLAQNRSPFKEQVHE